jgi:hypothetical protein
LLSSISILQISVEAHHQVPCQHHSMAVPIANGRPDRSRPKTDRQKSSKPDKFTCLVLNLSWEHFDILRICFGRQSRIMMRIGVWQLTRQKFWTYIRLFQCDLQRVEKPKWWTFRIRDWEKLKCGGLKGAHRRHPKLKFASKRGVPPIPLQHRSGLSVQFSWWIVTLPQTNSVNLDSRKSQRTSQKFGKSHHVSSMSSWNWILHSLQQPH